MKKLKVKIIKAALSSYWYAGQIGCEFYVEEHTHDRYRLYKDVTLSSTISKSDCEVIEEATPQPEPFDLERAKKGEFILCDGDTGKYMFTNKHPDGIKHIFQMSVNGGISQAQAVIFYSERNKTWFGGFNSHELPYIVTMAPKEPEYVEGWVIVDKKGIGPCVYSDIKIASHNAVFNREDREFRIEKIRFPKP